MTPLDEYPIAHEPTPPGEIRPPASDRRLAWLVGLAAFAIVLGATYFWWSRDEPEAPPATKVGSEPAPAEPPAPLGAPAEAIDVPPLAETDPLVRDLLGRLSSSPALMAWLATDGLIRTFVVAVDNVATGVSPAPHVRALRPREPFRVDASRGRPVAADTAHARYDPLAEAFVSLDPDGLARVYTLLKPRLAEAYRELGHPEGDIDAAVERAMVRLLQTPVPDGEVELIEAVESYRYAEPRLEALSPAQKQLLRMGPANVDRVQAHLRAVARALGIDEAKLP